MKNKYVGTAIFDIDGVLADIESEFCERFGTDKRSEYDFGKRYPDKLDLIDEFLSDPQSYWEVSPIFGGITLLRQAAERGWYIVIMTSRPEKTRGITLRWLDKYNIVYDQSVFEPNKGVLIDEMVRGNSKPMFLVDDAVHHLKNLAKGVVGVAWSQPWNINYYPRVHYDENSMLVVKKLDFYGAWTPFWR